MLEAGRYLSNRYEIVRRIGTGGMADVYRGKDHKLRRYVAIKVLKPEFAEDESFVRKFQIEAQAAAGMLHPNVVNVYDVGEDDGYNYMVMELVDGITLKDYIQKKGKLTDKETISIAIQMASGLDAAHKKNLVHRDVKPQNVMISKEGKVKVTDFGIARPTTSNTISANVMGSVHYTSPEQARGGICDIQSDIYSTGITIYEMIAGTVPFDGETTVAIAVKHLQEEILPPSEYTPNMYYSLEQIILKCTQKNPSKRYLSMDDLMLDLKHSLMDPDGDFVDLGGLVYQNQASKGYYDTDDDDDDYDDDDYDDDDYDDDDYDDDDYDDEDYDGTYKAKNKNGEEIDPKMKDLTKILMIVAAVIVGFTILFISAKAIGFFGGSAGEDSVTEELIEGIEVPNLEGLTEDEAKEALNELGLGYNVKAREESATYEEGFIISQDVLEGELVEVNTTINVVVSSGITELVTNVPNVVGATEDSAQQMINDLELKMDSDYEYSDEYDQGVVISANPSVGTEVAIGSTVTVVVSKGEEPPETVSTPNLVGQTKADAESALSSVDLVGSSTEAYSDTVASGVVIEQSVSSGTKVEVGSTIEYVVSKGAETKMVTMPSVAGKEAISAISELEASGFVVTATDQYDSVTAGYVISANVSAGTSVPVGTTIELIISLGTEPTVSEPSVDNSAGTDTESSGDATTDTTQ
ncbi:MAG: Stk1 family PASTA domain-containing Ser/Thr kinase [Eubacteriales bacterium]